MGPMLSPGFADGGIGCIPRFLERVQLGFGFFGRGGLVDLFQIGRHRFVLFPRHIPQTIAHHMDNASLYPGLRKSRFDRLGKTAQPIDTGDKQVVHAAIFQLIEDA